MVMTRARRHTELLLVILLFLLAFVPRAAPPVVITTDEQVHWIRRSGEFRSALATGQLENTAQAQHPGVITMWLGTAGLLLSEAVDGVTHANLDYPSTVALIHLPAVLVHALIVVLAYFLLKRLFKWRIALVAAVLWAADPFIVAHDRVLHIDGLATGFTAIAFLAALMAFQFETALDSDELGVRWNFLLLSGIFGGLAGLTKFSMLFVGGVIGIAALLRYWGKPRTLLRLAVVPVIMWTLVAVFVWFALYPATWQHLDLVIQKLVQGVDTALSPHEDGNFFLGQALLDPGPFFYPVATLLRMTPWTTLALIPFAAGFIRSPRRDRRLYSALLLFVILFIGFFTI